MEVIRIAGATVNQTPLDWNGNVQRLEKCLDDARKQGVQVLGFPELCISGYNCEDMFFHSSTLRQAEESLKTLLPHTIGMVVVLGLPVYWGGAAYNAAVVVQNGRLLGVNPKKLLPREGVHYEGRWFKPWPSNMVSEITLCGQIVPFGDCQYRFGSWGMALEICEEAWGAVPGAAAHARSGVELVVNPSASHFALGKIRVRETLIAQNSRAMQVHYLYVNNTGLEEGRLIYDGGVTLAQSGVITHRGPRFSLQDGHVTVADVDMAWIRARKSAGWSEGADDGDAIVSSHQIVVGTAVVPIVEPSPPLALEAGDEFSSPFDEFLQAETLALWDYLHKSRAKGYVVSLSGGCDSSAVAVLIGHMVARALTELGASEMSRRLDITAPVRGADDARSWIHQILTLAYQATAHSGPVTEAAAQELATALGARYHRIDVQPVVAAYRAEAEKALGRPLTWEQDDVALQNIQARARAPMIWMLANLQQALLVATSNRSEVAVGYATMDGDTAGGLAPLAGIDKHFLRQWLIWAEKDCAVGLGPLPALRKVNVQIPTAELRPPAAQQQDEKDLMPYPLLSRIEKLWIRDRLDPLDMVPILEREFPECSRKQLANHLIRFLQLWCRNQWKRERYAPGFQLDDESLDPKTWCRFPILSGGMQREIEQLKTIE